MNTLEYYNRIKDRHHFTHVSLHSILKDRDKGEYLEYIDELGLFYLYKVMDTHFLFLVFLDEESDDIECISDYIGDMRDFILLSRDRDNTAMIEYFCHLFDQAKYPIYSGGVPESVSDITREYIGGSNESI